MEAMSQTTLPGFNLECQLCHAKPSVLVYVQDVRAHLCLPCFYARYDLEYHHLANWCKDHPPDGEGVDHA